MWLFPSILRYFPVVFQNISSIKMFFGGLSLDKFGKIGTFSGRPRLIWGNAAWADMVRFGYAELNQQLSL